jgi:hypothetical protein
MLTTRWGSLLDSASGERRFVPDKKCACAHPSVIVGAPAQAPFASSFSANASGWSYCVLDSEAPEDATYEKSITGEKRICPLLTCH